MSTFAFPADASSEELAANMDTFTGKSVAIQPLSLDKVEISTTFGTSKALRVKVIDLETGELTSPHLLFWSRMSEQVLDTIRGGVDWAIGTVTNIPQQADPTKSVYLLQADATMSMVKVAGQSHYITIGTTGEYDHYSNIDIEEGYIKINHKGRESVEMIYPRRPGSIYHTSKTSSTYLIDFLCRTWMLKCTDVQQSVVFGTYTTDIDESKIYSRLDSDEAGGTVINRFIVQALLGVPLTIYGEGKHQRGFISLNDSIQALMLAVKNEPTSGHVQVWNQLSEWHSMNEIAGMVIEAAKNRGLNISTQHIPSPRTEYTGNHYYKYSTEKLASLGYKPTRTILEEIDYTFDVLIKSNDLSELKNVVMPKITWR